jgi:hypothetical protein
MASGMLMHMDESDWDREPVSEPDWVYDPPGEPDPSDEAVAGEETQGVRQRPPMAYERWSPEAEAKLVAGYLAGRSIDELAVEFGRRSTAIQRRLEQHAFAEWSQRHRASNAAEPH